MSRLILCALFFMGGATSAFAQSSSASYRVNVTVEGTNNYLDQKSGITIVTERCDKDGRGMSGLLTMMTPDIEGSSIAFDGGESCIVVDLLSPAAHYSQQWYRVNVTTVDTNHYVDQETGVIIVTGRCGEAAKGVHARLVLVASETAGSWMAFDGGESCDVVDWWVPSTPRLRR